jgi:hypothetical protein
LTTETNLISGIVIKLKETMSEALCKGSMTTVRIHQPPTEAEGAEILIKDLLHTEVEVDTITEEAIKVEVVIRDAIIIPTIKTSQGRLETITSLIDVEAEVEAVKIDKITVYPETNLQEMKTANLQSTFTMTFAATKRVMLYTCKSTLEVGTVILEVKKEMNLTIIVMIIGVVMNQEETTTKTNVTRNIEVILTKDLNKDQVEVDLIKEIHIEPEIHLVMIFHHVGKMIIKSVATKSQYQGLLLCAKGLNLVKKEISLSRNARLLLGQIVSKKTTHPQLKLPL